jgi:hypothetical protein
MISGLVLTATMAVAGEGEGEDVVARCVDVLAPGDLEAIKRRTVIVANSLGTGSAFFASPDGVLLTAAHVVGGAKTVTVTLEDGATAEGTVARRNVDADLALITVDLGRPAPCLPAASARAAVGDEVFAVGSPIGALTHSVSKGIVSGWREVGEVTVMQTDASLNPGNSGGPIVDGAGAVQGVVSSKLVGVGIEGVGFAVEIGAVEAALGFTWGDRTSGLAPREVDGGSAPSVGAGEVESRPASPAPIPTKRVCERSRTRVRGSDFDDGRTLESDDGLHQLTWSSGRPPMLMVLSPIEVGKLAMAAQAGATATDLLLEDGTVVHLPVAPLAARPGFAALQMGARVPVGEAVVLALASSPVTRIRMPDLAEEVAFDRSDGRKLRDAMACLALELGLVAGE